MHLINNVIIYLNKIYITAKKFSLNLSVPFLGKQSIVFQAKMNRIMAQYYPNIELKLYLKCTKRLSNLFRVKNITPYVLKSNVYKYSCAGCSASYIGKTSRHLHVRICEHMGISNLTNSSRLTPPFSAMHEHSKACTKIVSNSFKIIANGNSDIELLIKESLLIEDYHPSLNNNNSSFELRIFNHFHVYFLQSLLCKLR